MKKLNMEKRRRRRTFLYFYILLALLILLVTATYTWFSLSRTPRVSDMDLYISTRTGLELSPIYTGQEDDPWGQTVSFQDLVSEVSPLRPITWSERAQSFQTVGYGIDGRMTETFDILTDEENANRTDDAGYYVVGTFYARCGENCTVSLAKAVEVNEGENGAGTYVIGTPVWNGQTLLHDNGGQGAETAIRLGFRIEKVFPEDGEAPVFHIYEPNCDRHMDGSTEYVQTPSVDGAPELSNRLITQTASSWTEAYPVQRQVTVKQLGQFTSDTQLFSIQAGEVYEIKLYIWLEGQDMDCTNEIDGAQIIANVQFFAEYEGQGGMVEIPE